MDNKTDREYYEKKIKKSPNKCKEPQPKATVKADLADGGRDCMDMDNNA